VSERAVVNDIDPAPEAAPAKAGTERGRAREPALLPLPDWTQVVRWATAFVATVVVAITLIGNRVRAAGNDAVFSRSAVLRAIRFGGTYYENGIHPKGPLEEVAHDIAARVGGYEGHWHVISLMIAVSAAVLAYAAARTTRATGGNGYAAFAIAGVVYVHFTLSDAAYAGLLYSRNILVTLLAGAWILVLDDRPWTRSRRTQWIVAIGTGAVLGLAVQTILPAILDATAIGVAALVLLWRRVAGVQRRVAVGAATVATAAGGALLSAPLWYALRGSFSEFWASWWTYASYQNTGIGQSLGTQIAKGWDYAYGYYQDRPLVFLLLASFVAITVAWWSRLTFKLRVVHVALLGWFAGGWFQLVTGQRYSTHYFSVVAAPTALIGAALAGHAARGLMQSSRARRTAVAWPLIALLLALYLSSGTAHRLLDAAAITSEFTSVERDAARSEAKLSPTNRSVRAVLDMVSRDEDPLLAYSENQYIYPLYRRIPATRFQQRYFLIGSIYLGRRSEKYVLPDTWKLFADDLREANPAAFLQTDPVDSPQFAQYVAGHFTTAFEGADGKVLLRNDLADAIMLGEATAPWIAPVTPDPTGWRGQGTAARYVASGEATDPANRLLLASGACTRIDGKLAGRSNSAPGVVFHFEDTSADPTSTEPPALGHQTETRIALDGQSASTKDVNDRVLEAIDVPPSASFSLLVGRRSAALVVGERIVAAVAIPEATRVTAESLRPQLTIRDVRVGSPPPGSGC
jgi:hypothetical protein